MLDAECVVQESRERLVRADQLRAVFKSGHFGLQQGGYCVGIDQDTLLVFLTSALPSGALVSGLPPACSTPCSGSDLKAGVWRKSTLRQHAQLPRPRGQRHRGGAIPRPPDCSPADRSRSTKTPSVRLARQSKMVPRFIMDATLFTAVYSKTM